jgi:hypothetical protein
MRFRIVALLGIIMLCISPLATDRQEAYGQSTQVDSARGALVQAFVSVQEADLEGASPAQISQLASNLNIALSYEENATRLGSNLYANQSLKLSNSTSLEAQSVANAARAQTLFDQVSAYSLALVAGLGSALFVLEFHRLNDIARKIRLRRTRLE